MSRKTLLISGLLLGSPIIGETESFDGVNIRTQAYVVDQLKGGIGCAESIAVVQARTDEIFRMEQPIPNGQLASLGLRPLRMVKAFKGDVGVPEKGLFYIYWVGHEDVLPGKPSPQFYRPSLLPDDSMYLVLISRQREPIRERIANRYTPEFLTFVQDGQEMEVAEFKAKYNLDSLFSNRVYRLAGRCAFVVDYPEPVIEAQPDRREAVDYENSRIRAERKANPSTLSRSHFRLSNREVSEIVYISYLLGGKDGTARYADVAKDSPLLEPVETGKFKTNLGRRLAEATGVSKGDGNVD